MIHVTPLYQPTYVDGDKDRNQDRDYDDKSLYICLHCVLLVFYISSLRINRISIPYTTSTILILKSASFVMRLSFLQSVHPSRLAYPRQ